MGRRSLGVEDANSAEFRGGIDVNTSGEAQAGARRFPEGVGRSGG
jgi:hypothetical protein